MTSVQLPNYLRANRKRIGLVQDDVAFLLGAETGESVCRHERFTREPSLAVALAYEAIYQRPVHELFGGLHEKIEKEVATLAKALNDRTSLKKATRHSTRKIQTLTDIAARLSSKAQNL
jgi:transcriptional regulator with XRE-family HTH domain